MRPDMDTSTGPARNRLTSRDSIGRNAPRFSRERCASEMMAACAALGAKAPNGAGVGSLSGFKRVSSMESGACIAGFVRGSNTREDETKCRSPDRAVSNPGHW